MISHQHQCIFIHIPKVAGTSIIKILEDPRPPAARPLFPFDPDDPNKFLPPPPHLRASDYVRYGLATQAQFESYFKFAFVRNPWARLVSEYRYRLLPRKYAFSTWLLTEFPQPGWNDCYCHILPQYDFLYDEYGRQLVDFVGRFESLQRDFGYVCQKLGISTERLPRANASDSLLHRRRDNGWADMAKALVSQFSLKRWRNTHAHYRDYYDDKSRAFVAELYRKDIDTFGYEF